MPIRLWNSPSYIQQAIDFALLSVTVSSVKRRYALKHLDDIAEFFLTAVEEIDHGKHVLAGLRRRRKFSEVEEM